MSKKHLTWLLWLLITLIPIAGLIWSLVSPDNFEYYQTIARNWAITFGIVAPLFFILVQALQVIIAPISHYTVGAIGGYLYGPWLGGLLNYVGRMIGHMCAFIIARKLGRPILKKIAPDDFIEKYDKIIGGVGTDGKVNKLQPTILFLIYFLPLFPDDEISYIVGASKMKCKPFFLANLFGQAGGSLSLAYLGSGVSTNDPLFWILSISTLLGFPIIFFLINKNKKND